MLGKGYIHVDAPQVVATRRGTAFLGDNALAAAPTDTGFVAVAGWPRGANMVAGFLVQPGGEVAPIPPPPGVRAFIGVRAASHDGIAHVFWAGSADTSSMQFQHVNALWYAQFDGARWTAPERVFADTTLTLWAHQATSVIIEAGRAHLTAPLSTRLFGDDVLHVVRDRQGRGTVTRLGFEALYTQLARYSNDVLILATIIGAGPDRARVLVRRSADGGSSWSPPSVVYRSGLGTAYDPRLAVTPDGLLYAAWIVEAKDRPHRAESVYVARSDDQGVTWTSLPVLTAAPKVRDLFAVPDRRGVVHISLHSDENDGIVVGASLEGGQWRHRYTRGPTPFAAILQTVTPDSLDLVWHEWHVAGPERIPTMMVSRRTTCPDISPER
jgi:hypothetical protein